MLGYFINSSVILSYLLNFHFLELFSLLPLVTNTPTSNQPLTDENTTLVLLQTLSRHGARAPVFIYPTDPNEKDFWPEGLGKLTLLGKKQQYALGKILRARYQDFITTNPNEVLVNSSASDRCLTSAEATLASFYAPAEKWKLDNDLNWQPIPIHSVPLFQDKFLSFKGRCPRVEAEQKKQLLSLGEFFQKRQPQFEALSNYSGLNVSERVNALLLHDTLSIEKTNNLTIPEWVDLYWDELEEASLSIFWSIVRPPLVLRLRAGTLLQEISQNMIKKINGDLPQLKVQLYFAHDVNLASILTALNFTNLPRPPFCATLLFELHEMADTSMAVRLLYLNSTDPLTGMGQPHVLTLGDCSEFCPVENFTKKIQHLIPRSYEEECQLDSLNSSEINGDDVFRDIKNEK